MAVGWVLSFILLHVFWFVVRDFGAGPPPPLPAAGDVGGWAYTLLVLAMFVAAPAVTLALALGRRPLSRTLVIAPAAIGATVVLIRGLAGWLDQALRSSGLSPGGLTGLSYEQVFARAHPSFGTLLLSVLIDSNFVLGGILIGAAAWRRRNATS